MKVGAKSLERGSTFKPRRRKPLRTASQRERSAAWARGGRAKTCAVCGASGVQGHHVITQWKLRETARSLGLDAERLLWDARNRLWLCERHHKAHHARVRPVSWETLTAHAPKVVQFARELGLVPWLERTYPKVNERSSDV